MPLDGRYRMPKQKRKFGGEIYTYLILGDKREATADAARWRAKGYKARVVKAGRAYAVYYRKG